MEKSIEAAKQLRGGKGSKAKKNTSPGQDSSLVRGSPIMKGRVLYPPVTERGANQESKRGSARATKKKRTGMQRTCLKSALGNLLAGILEDSKEGGMVYYAQILSTGF